MIRILTDSTADLSSALVERYHIAIFPLHILTGEEDHLDGVDISPDEIYAWSDATKSTPKTAALSVLEAKDALRPILDAGDEIIAFTISEDMSTTYNNLCLAVKELKADGRVSVINSKNLSTGIGLQVIEAAILSEEGKTREEIVSFLLKIRERVSASFVVDTLTFLHRGGRCSSVAALAGSLLKLHPEIVVEDGKMHAAKKYRGELRRAIMEYVKDRESELLNAKPDRVFITTSGHVENEIREVKAYLEGLNHFKEVLVTRAGGVISSHCGPGTLGVLYIRGE